MTRREPEPFYDGRGILRECLHVVARAGDGAPPLPAEVEGDAAIFPAQRLDLRLVHGAAPEEAVGEEDRLPPRARVLVVEVRAVDFDPRHAGILDRSSLTNSAM